MRYALALCSLVALFFFGPLAFAATGGRVDFYVGSGGSGNSAASVWDGGKGLFMVEALTWGGAGASVRLQVQNPRGTWIDVPSTTLWQNGVAAFELPAGLIRASVVTANGLYVYGLILPR